VAEGSHITSGGTPPPIPRAWRDRTTFLTGAALIAFAGVAWIGVVLQGMGMPPGMTGDADSASLPGAAVFLSAWGVMMVAMMLPSATPMIVLYGRVSRNRSHKRYAIPTVLFTAIYLVIWVGFGLLVYVAGLVLNALAYANAGVADWFPYGLAAVLLAAGVYQFTALKQSCLRYCRTPLSFFMARWRSGYAGTARLAFAHAAYCIGCCAGLMLVLVAAGAMSLPWVLLIAAVVFVEKLLPRGDAVARVAGVGFVLVGLSIALDPSMATMLRGSSMSPSR
jgi:predicted metal-binding membrane protein